MLKSYVAARDAGDRHYQGSPCQYGHDGKRYVTNRGCVRCEVLRSAGKKLSEPEKHIRHVDESTYNNPVLMLGRYNP